MSTTLTISIQPHCKKYLVDRLNSECIDLSSSNSYAYFLKKLITKNSKEYRNINTDKLTDTIQVKIPKSLIQKNKIYFGADTMLAFNKFVNQCFNESMDQSLKNCPRGRGYKPNGIKAAIVKFLRSLGIDEDDLALDTVKRQEFRRFNRKKQKNH